MPEKKVAHSTLLATAVAHSLTPVNHSVNPYSGKG